MMVDDPHSLFQPINDNIMVIEEPNMHEFLVDIDLEDDSTLDPSSISFSLEDEQRGGIEENFNVEPTPVTYSKPPQKDPMLPCYHRNSSFGSLFGSSNLTRGTVSSFRNSSIAGSLFGSLCATSVSSIDTIHSTSSFDVNETFPAPHCLNRQVTPPPPQIPKPQPFSSCNKRRVSSRTRKKKQIQFPGEEHIRDEADPDKEPKIVHHLCVSSPAPPVPAAMVSPALDAIVSPPASVASPPQKSKTVRNTPNAVLSLGDCKTKKRVAKTAKKWTPSKAVKKQKSASPQKRRLRRVDPEVKASVVKTNKDVLLGRGGCSNHHPGNKLYRKHILGLQRTYKTLSRDEKTDFSHDVIQWLYDQGGRFLKRDKKKSPWYVVTDMTARQKISQALREDHSPEGRALKKSKGNSSSSS